VHAGSTNLKVRGQTQCGFTDAKSQVGISDHWTRVSSVFAQIIEKGTIRSRFVTVDDWLTIGNLQKAFL
jgi:glutaredoxin-related protein